MYCSSWYKKEKIPNEVLNKIAKYFENANKIAVYKYYDRVIYKVDSITFKNIFTENRKYLFNGDSTSNPSTNDYKNSECYLMSNGLSGFAITNDGWLISMFSNDENIKFGKIASKIIQEKANKLVLVKGDKEENHLEDYYAKNWNFIKIAETIDDSKYKEIYDGNDFLDNYIARKGIPKHIFMVNKRKILDGKFKVFDDFYDAMKYVDNLKFSK